MHLFEATSDIRKRLRLLLLMLPVSPQASSSGKSVAQASLERIQNFEEAFARIRSATGIDDIQELVRLRAFLSPKHHHIVMFLRGACVCVRHCW